jgi:long-chain acyl-CoA synthetase
MKDIRGLTIYEALENAAAINPDGIAYDFLGFKRTYGKFLEDVHICADSLKHLGIGEGDIVTMFLPNIPRALVLFYTLSKIGAISNFIHPKMPVSQISGILKAMKPKAVLIPGFMTEKIRRLSGLLADSRIIPVHMHEFMQFHMKVLTFFRYLPKTIYNMSRGRKYYKDRSYNYTRTSEHDICKTSVILLTGGSTGDPKGVCLSDLNINTAAYSTSEVMESHEDDDSMLAVLPLFHGYGLVNCIHTTICESSRLILLPYYNRRFFKNALMVKKPAYMTGIPRLYDKMADILKDEDIDLSFIRGLYCGGSKLSETIYEKINSVLKSKGCTVKVQEGYGLTESVGAVTLMPAKCYRSKSIGKAYPGVSIRMLSEPEGEITVSSDMVMNGYFGIDDSPVFEEDGVRWLRTGDMGYIDEEGYVYFTGRSKRMYKISGYEVFPDRAESFLNNIPGVENCCMVESERNGLSCSTLYIVVSDGTNEKKMHLSVEKTIKENLPGWYMPEEIIFTDSIPKTLLMKNDYRSLS